MVKTDDFILMMEDGSCATATLTTSTTAVLMEKMVAEKVKNGGTDGKRGELLIEAVDDAMARHDVWLPESHSPDTKCSSADFDQSDESGGDQSGVSNGSHRNCRFSMDGRANDRRMFTASIANDVDDRRLRRQIANCNERRRMQSINDGFQALRQLLPRKDGDKMSKAAILAATAEFIQSLLREKDKLMEENCAVTAKKRRMDTEDTTDQGILREEVAAPNVVECLSTIGDLRLLLQKETQLRMAYEKEMAELRCQLRLSPPSSALVSLPPFPSPLPPSDFASISSSSSSAMANGREGLLIELVRHQEQQPQLFRPTAVLPSDVQLLTSAINSLANCSPGGLPLQMQQQQENNGPMIMPTNEMPTEIGKEAQQPTKVFETKVPLPVVQQRTMGNGEETNGWPTTEGVGVGTDCATTATISQQNLQALVLAIRHLEGSANVSSPLQNGCPPSVLSSAADNNLVLFH